jgi:hypothetical protein
MVARFTRTYLVVLVALIVIVSLVTMTTHHPLQSYVDPLTGRIFGEGGVEKARPDAIATHEISGVKGGVIMPKLGNATAKLVSSCSRFCRSDPCYLGQNSAGQRGNSCTCDFD